MGTEVVRSGGADLMKLLGDVVGQSERLAGQQWALLISELGAAARDAGGAAAAVGAGVGLLAAGGVLSTAAAVHLLHRLTGLPLWACYALAAGAAGAAGAGLVAAGRAKAVGLQRPLLPQTTAALKDNVAWLRNQLTTTPA